MLDKRNRQLETPRPLTNPITPGPSPNISIVSLLHTLTKGVSILLVDSI